MTHMKTPLALFSAVLLLTATYASAETVIYETGFEPSDKFQPGALENSGGTWKTNGDYPFGIKDAGSDSQGQILESATDKAGAGSRAWITGIDFKGADKVSVEMDVRAVRSGAPGYAANIHLGNFEDAPKVGPQGTAALISMRGSGRMVIFNGETETDIKGFKDGEWIRLRIDADPIAKKYSVAVDGETVASDLDFRDPATADISALGFTHYSASDARVPCSMAVDNVKITAQ